MTFTMWTVLAIAMAACWGLGWISGDDRGQRKVNRQWVARSDARYRLSKIVTGAD